MDTPKGLNDRIRCSWQNEGVGGAPVEDAVDVFKGTWRKARRPVVSLSTGALWAAGEDSYNYASATLEDVHRRTTLSTDTIIGQNQETALPPALPKEVAEDETVARTGLPQSPSGLVAGVAYRERSPILQLVPGYKVKRHGLRFFDRILKLDQGIIQGAILWVRVEFGPPRSKDPAHRVAPEQAATLLELAKAEEERIGRQGVFQVALVVDQTVGRGQYVPGPNERPRAANRQPPYLTPRRNKSPFLVCRPLAPIVTTDY